MFGDIVVPVDGSNHGLRALRVADCLAERVGGRVLVIAFTRNLLVNEFRKRIHEQAEATVGGVNHRTEVKRRSRSVAKDIVAYLDDRPDALLCMPTHGYDHWAGAVGSVTTRVLRSIHQPVLLVGPQCTGRAFDPDRPVLVPSDGHHDSDRARHAAEGWAGRFGSPIHTMALPTDEVLDHRDLIDRILDGANGVSPSVIAMRTDATVGMRRLVHGSVVADVLRHARSPGLVVAEPPE